jgi:hypothetical protein
VPLNALRAGVSVLTDLGDPAFVGDAITLNPLVVVSTG